MVLLRWHPKSLGITSIHKNQLKAYISLGIQVTQKRIQEHSLLEASSSCLYHMYVLVQFCKIWQQSCAILWSISIKCFTEFGCVLADWFWFYSYCEFIKRLSIYNIPHGIWSHKYNLNVVCCLVFILIFSIIKDKMTGHTKH